MRAFANTALACSPSEGSHYPISARIEDRLNAQTSVAMESRQALGGFWPFSFDGIARLKDSGVGDNVIHQNFCSAQTKLSTVVSFPHSASGEASPTSPSASRKKPTTWLCAMELAKVASNGSYRQMLEKGVGELIL